MRALLYIARVYEQIIDNRAIYRTNLFKMPEFFTLYNGKEAYPDAKKRRFLFIQGCIFLYQRFRGQRARLFIRHLLGHMGHDGILH